MKGLTTREMHKLFGFIAFFGSIREESLPNWPLDVVLLTERHFSP